MGLQAPTRFPGNLPEFLFTVEPSETRGNILSRFVPIVRMMQTASVRKRCKLPKARNEVPKSICQPLTSDYSCNGEPSDPTCDSKPSPGIARLPRWNPLFFAPSYTSYGHVSKFETATVPST